MLEPAKLNNFLTLFKEFTIEDAKFFFSTMAKSKTLKAGDIYVQPGDMHRKVSHIKSGLIRAYMINESGAESTLFFRKEDQQIAPYDCIFNNTPARMYLEAFENTELFEVDYDRLQDFLERHPRYEKARKHFIQQLLMESFLRLESFVLLSPEERYLEFMGKNPMLLQRVPEKYIASILGITPESLSRIKRRIKEKSDN